MIHFHLLYPHLIFRSLTERDVTTPVLHEHDMMTKPSYTDGWKLSPRQALLIVTQVVSTWAQRRFLLLFCSGFVSFPCWIWTHVSWLSFLLSLEHLGSISFWGPSAQESPVFGLWTGTSCQISSSIRLEIKCTLNVKYLNHPDATSLPLTQPVEKVSSTKPILGAKNVRDWCFSEQNRFLLSWYLPCTAER